MARKYLSIDERLIAGVQLLANIPESEVPMALQCAVKVVRDEVDVEEIQELAAAVELELPEYRGMVTAAAGVFWECARVEADDATIDGVLKKIGLAEGHANSFLEVYTAHRDELFSLKEAFRLRATRYHDLKWRIDVELGRRTMTKMANPKFMIRLDTKAPGGGADNIESTHLQCDYATMNRLQRELQRAVDELSSAHSQRMTRYIR